MGSRPWASASDVAGFDERAAWARSMVGTHEWRKEVFVLGERSMALDREIPVSRRPTPGEAAKDLWRETPRREQRRLHRDRGDSIPRGQVLVDERPSYRRSRTEGPERSAPPPTDGPRWLMRAARVA